MLKALRRFTQLLRVHIYVPGCCKYIRMTNGLQPLVELCMDGCFADFSDLLQVRRVLAQQLLEFVAQNFLRCCDFPQTSHSNTPRWVESKLSYHGGLLKPSRRGD